MNAYPEDTALIQSLVAYAGTTPAAVAKCAGVAVSTVNRPFNGSATNRLGRSVLEKLRAAFPEFPGWLAPASTVSDQRLPYNAKGPEPSDVVPVSQIDLRYGMGGTFIDGPVVAETVHFSRTWLRHFTRAAPEHLFWATGEGDSMEPTIRSGEMVLIDASQQTPRMAEGIWAVTIGEIGMIKRLHFPSRGEVQLLSDNQLIPPIPVAEDELQIIGRVVAVIRRL